MVGLIILFFEVGQIWWRIHNKREREEGRDGN
jgi:hypothetical protein